jgi:hypothetical protein
MIGYDAGAPFALLYRREAMQEAAQAELGRLAEDRDRREWTEDIRRRLGLVAEVHRCRVSQCWCCAWNWDCLRPGCWSGEHCGSQGNALASALAHARSSIPEPPEQEPWSELNWTAYEELAVIARDADERFEWRTGGE